MKNKDKKRKKSEVFKKEDARETCETNALDVSSEKSPWNESDKKKLRREFPGPADASVSQRIAIERKAYSDISAHVHNSIDSEVCGVLIGDFCEDEFGVFVHIRHIIAGSSTQQGSAHVTFTQNTWNEIHAELERNYKGLSIVGWYHSHPGFGVTFSDMDLFIQKNFFSLSTQCALVMDPLGGDVAVCINGSAGPVYIDRVWIDGREKKLFLPVGSVESSSGIASGSLDLFRECLSSLENRVNQVVQVMDQQQRGNSRLMLLLFCVVGIVLTFCAGYTLYRDKVSEFKPPELAQYVPVPIQIGNDTAILGIGIFKWNIPPKLLAMQADLHNDQLRIFESMLRADLSRQAKKENSEGWFSRSVNSIKRLFTKKSK